MDEPFARTGARPFPEQGREKPQWHKGKPLAAMAVLGVILLGCLACGLFIPQDPAYMDLYHADQPPGPGAWFGTDSMGRDIFSMIWAGGRASLFIGFSATAVSTGIAILVGALSGLAPGWLDSLLMRAAELFLSIPSLLLALFIQAALGEAHVGSLSLVIGLTSWAGIAKVVRTEVRQARGSGYVAAARCMGAGFSRILFRHLVPNVFPSILFMVVMNIRGAIMAESTLSFLGLGLPLEQVSWGSMLSLSERAALSGAWWAVWIPGGFLVATLLCVTEIGNALREGQDRRRRNL